MATRYLITGANRGIGRGLTNLILARPNTTVLALVRDPDDETSKSLASVPRGSNSILIVLPYDAKDPNDAAATAITTAQRDHGITHLDVVIANAGMLGWYGPAVDTSPEAIHEHITVNTVGPLLLFKACLPLLQRASSSPEEKGAVEDKGPAKFIAISSALGSTTLIPQFRPSKTLAYGLSKAALNHTCRKFSVDYPDLVIEMLTPGPVRTDLTREFTAVFDKALKANPKLADRFADIDNVVKGLLECIDSASKETSGGFRDWKGEVIPW
ncbi:hypothetical protein A1O1_07573 [Capronia coronata CBS 617.96]|uniref:Alcohol dehydrogenase n=1 Tax=Capronia coronata CBS 617.96 TaxID=1182541 RepID=W9YGV2_9EURO|nr:uncharacterized protein A1O1_07573 [Capronia coronata CBS 617.96]EXJ81509.1 hypothetical protein A1O1_07573 [Capronia coronata CBS 617.96]